MSTSWTINPYLLDGVHYPILALWDNHGGIAIVFGARNARISNYAELFSEFVFALSLFHFIPILERWKGDVSMFINIEFCHTIDNKHQKYKKIMIEI